MKALTAAEMREVDRLTTERSGISGSQLMENAGKSVAEFVLHQISLGFQSPVRSVVVLCGKGNNGGDGFVAARHLRQEIRHTSVLLFGGPSELKGDAALNFQRWREIGGETFFVENEAALQSAWARIAAADVILDALLGTGLRGGATGYMARTIDSLNTFSQNATSATPALIVAVDIPSGMSSDGEAVEGSVVCAHYTVTFTAPKIGQLVSNDSSRCGGLNVRAIGTQPALIDELGKGNLRCAGPDEFAKLPLIRPADSNKGLYGHILVIAGSAGKSGAAVLAGTGALKAGAGLVTIATPDAVQSVVASSQPEYMTEPLPTHADGSIAIENLDDAAFAKIIKGKTVLALGPGLGQESGTQKFIRTLVKESMLPTILDADGLNAFASNGDELRDRKSQFLAITPHPGEMARLLGVTTKEVQKDRVRIATESAKRWNACVLLKGFRTILASPGGQIFVNTTGNPGLAKGGSGDVLTGILAALTGQFGTQDWLRVLTLGVWLHGRAADTLVEDADPSGILASDVARALPYARFELLEEIRRGG
jgi:NAD(P)H-hydrate epimerase